MDDGASKAPTDNSQGGDPVRKPTARRVADDRQDDWVGHGPAAQPPAAQPAAAQPGVDDGQHATGVARAAGQRQTSAASAENGAASRPANDDSQLAAAAREQSTKHAGPANAQGSRLSPDEQRATVESQAAADLRSGLAAQAGSAAPVQPAAVQPAAMQPAAVQPAAAQSAAVQPAPVQPAAVRPVANDGQRATGTARVADPRAAGESQTAGGVDTRTFVVVTRAEADNGPLSTQLRELGLTVLLWPAVSVAVAETSALEEALENINTYDWIVFASRHAVAAVIERVETPPPNVRVAAVGKATGQVLRQRGWPVDLLPEDANAAALVSEFATKPMQGTRVLFPASSRALPTIAAGLTQLGATVTQVEAYRTEPASLDVDACRAWIERDVIAAVTFASPSAVIELEHALAKPHFDRLLKAAKVIAIGPTTARALEEHGCTPIMAETANLSGLAQTTFRSLQTRD